MTDQIAMTVEQARNLGYHPLAEVAQRTGVDPDLLRRRCNRGIYAPHAAKALDQTGRVVWMLGPALVEVADEGTWTVLEQSPDRATPPETAMQVIDTARDDWGVAGSPRPVDLVTYVDQQGSRLDTLDRWQALLDARIGRLEVVIQRIEQVLALEARAVDLSARLS